MPRETRYNIYDTPQKEKVQGAHEYCVAKGFPHNVSDVSNFFGVKDRFGYDLIQPGALSRTKAHQEGNKTQGRKQKLSGADVRETDHLLEESRVGIEAKGMSWDAVAWTLDRDVSGQTLRQTIGQCLQYGKYKAVIKEWAPEPLNKKRKKWSKDMYAKYPKPEDWYRVRFSDEMHCGYGPKGHLWIIRKQGNQMRYRHDNIQYRDPPPKKIPREYTPGALLAKSNVARTWPQKPDMRPGPYGRLTQKPVRRALGATPITPKGAPCMPRANF
ncbi:hypothetical protein OEA41_001935 [Lepraria neglecta]|uniref:Uncharacterized protein n=1 Tax=Lepraria neglecta TaxID=209136 RepID=A0AAE0DLT3_9LECA|nr:hypothetical protein OEA41_001935 [Lepraria neglecta]